MKHALITITSHRIQTIILALVFGFASISPAATVSAEAAGGMVIMAVQTASAASASDEYVVLMNTGDIPVDLKDWELQYQSSAGTTWSVKSKLTAVAYPRQYYVAATAGVPFDLVQDALTAGMAAGGGHMRLASPPAAGGAVVDLVGWGAATHAYGSPAPAPAAGNVLVRKLDSDDMPINTGNNAADFEELGSLPELSAEPETAPVPEPMPEPSPMPTAVPEPTPSDVPAPSPGPTSPPTENPVPEATPVPEPSAGPTPLPEPTPVPDTPGGLVISELLPNPALPALDSEAEYVEIHNPGQTAIDLEGYTLLTGNNLTYKAPLAGTLEAGGYMALTATAYRQALGNASGRAEIRFGETTIDTSPAYSSAPDGDAWALVQGAWQWTATPTPSAANILSTRTAPLKSNPTAAAKANAASVKPKASATPKPAAKTTAKTTAKATKASTKTSAKQAGTGKPGGQEVYEEPAAHTSRNMALLAGVGGLAILYGLYEYRQDISNRFKRCRDYLSARRKHGRGIAGR